MPFAAMACSWDSSRVHRFLLVIPPMLVCVASCKREAPPAISIDEIMASVVEVVGERGSGTGFLAIDRQTIVTNFHVVSGQSSLRVRFSNGVESAVAGYRVASPMFDLALLHLFEEAPVGRPLVFAKQRSPVGSEVTAAGNPRGLQGTVSKGVVSGFRSWPEIVDSLRIKDPDRISNHSQASEWVQTTAPVSEGNSGGPLLNAKGEVVGVNTWQLSSAAGQNLNFALDIRHVEELASTISMLKIRSLATLPSDSWRGVSDPDSEDFARTYHFVVWDRIASILGRWYANNSILSLDIWDGDQSDDDLKASRRRVVDQLRGCASRTMVDIEELGRIRKNLLQQTMVVYMDGIYDRLIAIAASYRQAAKEYDSVLRKGDEEVKQWRRTLLEAQSELNDYLQAHGLAMANRLSFVFDFNIESLPALMFQPAECVWLCIREIEVPEDVFGAVFTGTPRRFLLATYNRHVESAESKVILDYIMRIWPQGSGQYKVAEELLQQREKDLPQD
jgi:hypothetical protein